MKNKLKYLFSILFGAALLTGCFPEEAEEALKYSGPTLVEFKNETLGVNPALLEKNGITTNADYAQTLTSRTVLASKRGTDTLTVQLVGPQRNTETVIPFTVEGTAEEGVHYSLMGEAADGTVTIPANSSKGYIVYDIIEGALEIDSEVSLTFKLQDTEEVELSANYSTFEIIIWEPFRCPEVGRNFTGTYKVSYQRGSGTPYVHTTTVRLDPEDPNAIFIDNFWGYGKTVRAVIEGCPEGNTVRAIRIPKQDYVADLEGYGPSTVRTAAANTSVLNLETGNFAVGFRAEVAAGSFGDYIATFTKQ